MPEASRKGAQFAVAKLIANDRDREVGVGRQTFCDPFAPSCAPPQRAGGEPSLKANNLVRGCHFAPVHKAEK